MSEESPPEEEPGDRLGRRLGQGARLLGGLAGASVSLFGGPGGALGGAATGWLTGETLERVAREVAARVGERGAMRAGAAAAVITADVEARAAAGGEPRDDGFFEPRADDRPAGEELLEGILRQAAETWEERKLPHVAHIYDGVAADADISPAHANYLLRLADRLTYRQLALLAVLADEDTFRARARASSTNAEGRTQLAEELAMELDDLGDSGLLGVRVEGKVPYRSGRPMAAAARRATSRWAA
jgi:hypothetical protein